MSRRKKPSKLADEFAQDLEEYNRKWLNTPEDSALHIYANPTMPSIIPAERKAKEASELEKQTTGHSMPPEPVSPILHISTTHHGAGRKEPDDSLDREPAAMLPDVGRPHGDGIASSSRIPRKPTGPRDSELPMRSLEKLVLEEQGEVETPQEMDEAMQKFFEDQHALMNSFQRSEERKGDSSPQKDEERKGDQNPQRHDLPTAAEMLFDYLMAKSPDFQRCNTLRQHVRNIEKLDSHFKDLRLQDNPTDHDSTTALLEAMKAVATELHDNTQSWTISRDCPEHDPPRILDLGMTPGGFLGVVQEEALKRGSGATLHAFVLPASEKASRENIHLSLKSPPLKSPSLNPSALDFVSHRSPSLKRPAKPHPLELSVHAPNYQARQMESVAPLASSPVETQSRRTSIQEVPSSPVKIHPCDITLLAEAVFGADESDHNDEEHPFHRTIGEEYPFDIVICDATLTNLQQQPDIATEDSSGERKMVKLLFSQLWLGLEHIRPGGTMVIRMSKLGSWRTVRLITDFMKICTGQLCKPEASRKEMSSFYLVAKGLRDGSKQEETRKVLESWKKVLDVVTHADDEVYAEAKEKARGEVEDLLADYGQKLVKAGEKIWKSQADALDDLVEKAGAE